MGSLLIVFDHPPIGCLSDLGQVTEQVEIEQFIPVRPVKTFNVGVLVWFPGLDVLDHHADGFSPGNEFAAQELRPVIDPENIRQPPLQSQALKDPNQASAGYGCVNLDMNYLAVKIVHHVKGSKPFAGREHIAHKIGRPDLIGQWRYQQGLLDALRQPFLRPSLLVQLKIAVDTVHAFMIPTMTIPSQCLERFPEAPAGMAVDHRIDSVNNFGIAVSALGGGVKRRPGQPDRLTALPNRKLVLGHQIDYCFAFLWWP